jgi:hypothetical protein
MVNINLIKKIMLISLCLTAFSSMAYADSYMAPKDMVLGDSNTGFIYKRTSGLPSVGVGTSQPSATFNANVVSKFTGNVGSLPVVVFPATSGNLGYAQIPADLGNVFIIKIGSSQNLTQINLYPESLGSFPRLITVYIWYNGGVASPANVPIFIATAAPVGAPVAVKWPNADPPVLTNVLGKVDILTFFWPGTIWGQQNIVGAPILYGTADFGY